MSADDPRIARWINPVIREMQAYHVPDAGGLIKLDAMENPYTFPEDLCRAWLEVLGQAPVNRYPDPEAKNLKAAIANVMQIPDGQAILLGNGSDELIQMIVSAVAAPGRCLLAPEPGFVMYRIIAGMLGLEYTGVPLCEDFSLDTDAMLAAIEANQPAVIFLASPNNPTGNSFDREAVKAIVAAAPGLVVMDEAYFIFSGSDFLDLPGHYDNLLIMRTLSKLGLAGLRVGLLAGPPDWLRQFDKIRLPYNLNVLSQLSAEFFLGHYGELQQQAARIVDDRAVMYQALQAIQDIEVYPSEANFLLFKCQGRPANEVHQALKEEGVLIKNLHDSHPMLEQCLRVTVGTPEENDAFLEGLRQALVENG